MTQRKERIKTVKERKEKEGLFIEDGKGTTQMEKKTLKNKRTKERQRQKGRDGRKKWRGKKMKTVDVKN